MPMPNPDQQLGLQLRLRENRLIAAILLKDLPDEPIARQIFLDRLRKNLPEIESLAKFLTQQQTS